jgi:hypothetical protein
MKKSLIASAIMAAIAVSTAATGRFAHSLLPRQKKGRSLPEAPPLNMINDQLKFSS